MQEEILQSNPITPTPTPASKPRLLRYVLAFALLILLLGGILVVRFTQGTQPEPNQLSQQTTAEISLDELQSLEVARLNITDYNQLLVNGELKINGAFVLPDSEPPTNPQSGQIFFNTENNSVQYYNGTEFVQLALTKDVCLVGATNCGFLRVGDVPEVVLPQDLSTTASPAFANLNLSGQLSVSDGGTGVGSFTANGVLYGNGSNQILDTAAPLAGQILIGNALGVPSFVTLTGDISINSSGVTEIGVNTVGPAELLATAVTAGSYGDGTSYPIFTVDSDGRITSVSSQAIGSGAVVSLNSLAGVLTLAGTANQINIVSGGSTITLSTPQDIATTSNVTFNNVSSNGLLSSTGGLTANGNISLSSTAGNTTGIGNSTGALTLTGSSSSAFILNSVNVSAAEFNVLDGGIDESEVAGVVTDVTAGSGLTGGGASGSLTLNIGAGIGITVNANDIAVIYGSAANTAAQGNVTFTCPSGTGNLTGTGNSITIGTGGTCDSLTVVNNPTFSGLVTANGNLTVEAGDTFTFNSDAFTDLTGTGLQISSGSLQTTLGTSVDLASAEVTGTLGIGNGGTGATTAQAAINALAGLTTDGDLLYHNGANSTRLARGTNGECLTSNATTIVWGTCTPAGSGNYIQNQNASQQAASNFWISGTGQADVSLLTPALDTATAIALGIGNTTATSVGICNSAVCDTLSLGTNTDADAINIGDSLDTVSLNGALTILGTTLINSSGTATTTIGNGTGTLTVTGSASSAIILNGVNVSAAEFNLLDGHDVALVDTNDAVNTAITGTGALNSGSITSGFGAIDNADTITGTTLNATTGLNTGAGAGTQRIDSSGNLVNIGNLTATSSITIASTGAGNDIILNGADILDVQDNASFAGTITVSGLTTLNGGLTLETGDLFIFNGDSFTDLTGTGLQVSGNSLQTTLGTSVDLGSEITGVLPIVNGGTASSTSQGAINNISGLTTTGDLLYFDGVNSARLARGANGQCLTADITTLVWQNCNALVNLQSAYDTGNTIVSSNNRDVSFTLADTATDSNFIVNVASGSTSKFAVQNNGTDVLSVTSGVVTLAPSGGTSVSNGINNNSGGLTNTGAVSGVTTLSLSGAISGGTTYSGSGNINTTGGSIQTNSTTRIDNSGNLTNIGNLTATGAITIASSGAGNDIVINGADILDVQDNASFAGTLTVSGLTTLNGDLTVQPGDTFTFNSDAFTDLTGTGLQISSGSLQTTLGTSVDLASAEVTGTLGIGNGGTGATTAQAAINALAGLTTDGDLLYHNGANSTRLARGSTGQCLTSTSGSIQWGSCAGSGSGATLQAAYDNGNTITTTDNRNISFSLDDTTTDSDFIVDLLGTGNTFEIRDGGTAVATFSDTGTILFKNTSDSTSAFQVQDSSGDSILTVDTTNDEVEFGRSADTSAKLVFYNATNSNTLTIQSGTTGSNLVWTLPTANGANGDCLQTNGSGTLSFSACTGGAGGGVTSIDGLTGVVSVANATGSGSIITIDDASTSAKGIAQFNSTNFTASAGAINTIQDIATTSNVTFNNLTANGDVTIGNASTDRLSVNAQVLGATALVLQGATDNGFATSLNVAEPTSNNTIIMPNASGTVAVSASGNIALDAAGNVTFTGQLAVSDGGTGASTAQVAINNISGLTTNGDLLYHNGTNSIRLARGSSGQCLTADNTTILWQTCSGLVTLQNSYDNGNTITTSDNRNIGFTLADTTVDSDFIVNLLGTTNTFEIQDAGVAFVTFGDGGTALFRNTSNSTTAFQIQNSAGTTNVLTADTSNARLGVGTATPDARLDVEAAEDTELIRLSDSTNGDSAGIFAGNGSPEGVVTGQLGSIYTDHANGKIYKKGSGDGTNTGWEEIGSSQGVHSAKMTRAAAQSLTHAGSTKIAWDTETYDVGDIADSVTNDRFNIKKAGKYLVNFALRVPNLDDNEIGLAQLYMNGSMIREIFEYGACPGSDCGVSLEFSETLNLAVNDYFELYIFHNEGANQNTSTNSYERPIMSVTQIDGAGGGTNPEVGTRVYHNAAQSINNATTTKLNYNSERYDTYAIHDNVTNNTRLTAPTTGKYLITSNVLWASSTFGLRELSLYLNNTSTIAAVRQAGASGADGNTQQSVSTVYELTAGDYVETRVYQDSGGALNVTNTGNYSPEFTMTKIDGGISSTLQAAYNSGNTVTTTDNRDLTVTLADTATDSSMVVNMQGAGDFKIQDAGSDRFTFRDDGQLVVQNSGSIIAANVATATTGTTSGTGTNTTTVVLTGAVAGFANGEIILIDNAGQDYYTRITAGGGTASLTVSPAVTYEASRTVTEYTIQNIGATISDYTTSSNRFFQGYFLGGVVVGAGSTTLSDGNLESTNDLILQRASGDVGIGLQNATARLHVVGAINTSFTPGSWTQNVILDNAATSTQNIVELRVAGTKRGSFRVDNSGNIVINPSGSGRTYISWDEGSGGVNFGNGAGGVVASINSAGTGFFNGGVTVDGLGVIDDGAGWHRTYGNTGWYNGTWGGGWNMEDSTYIRVYGSKQVLLGNGIATAGSNLVCAPFSILTVCASDGRLKENVRSIGSESGLDLVRKFNPVFYDWKEGKGDKNNAGFIAQDLLGVLPDGLLKTNPNDGYYIFAQQELMPFVVKAIQQLDVQVQDIDTRLSVVESGYLPELHVSGVAKFAGELRMTGLINTAPNAITKNFTASGTVTAGSVVVLDTSNEGHVLAATTDSDRKVVGVAINDANAGQDVRVAISGNVQVSVYGGASIGDLLVTAPVIGKAKVNNSPTTGSLLGKITKPPDVSGLAWLLITLD